MKSIRLFVLVSVLAAAASMVGAQSWGTYNNIDGHVSINRAAEAGYWRWTYTFWHGNQAVPTDPVYGVSVRYLTADDGGVDGVKTGNEHYWDYTGKWETGSGPGTNPTDYVWNGDYQNVSSISEVPSGSVYAGLWQNGSANEGEYRRFIVSFLTDLPGVGRNYLDIYGGPGISHAVIGEVPNVPEPTTMTLALFGLPMLARFRKRK